MEVSETQHMVRHDAGGRLPATRHILRRLLGDRARPPVARSRPAARGPQETRDLRQLVAAMPDRCSTMLRGRGIALQPHLPAEALPVRVRDPAIGQLLMHLVAIACEAMPDGGTLHVLARAEGGQAVLSVVDAPLGGSAPALAGLFHRPPAPASRASVTACLHIADEHDGRIYAAPSPGGRLGVTLRLPLLGAGRTEGVRPCHAA